MTRPHREPGIRREWNGKIKAYVRVRGELYNRRFRPGTSLETVRRWRSDTRRLHTAHLPTAGSLGADIDPFLRQIAHRPKLVKERRQQLRWWAERFPHRTRHTLTTAEIREALSALRTTKAASTCNHYKQALFSLYAYLDGKDAPNPVRAVESFTSPPLEARGLEYDLVRLVIDTMSDQGHAGRGQSRINVSKAKVRCRVLAWTGMRHSELMRYRPEHWNRVEHTLTVLTGKKGRTRTIPLTEDGEAALHDLEDIGALGSFSTSPVRLAFRRALAKLGLKNIRPYDLRHSYGTAMYKVTGETRIVKELLGHSSTRITERYTLGFVPDYMKLAAKRFGELTGTSKG